METKKIRVAMIGFGGIAKSHKRAYDELSRDGVPVELVAICDINPEQFKKAQAINLEGNPKYDLSCQRLYTDLDQMLENQDFDMADICLPSYMHKEYTIKMLRAGKHVLCEKPMALNSADCLEMIKTAEECRRELMIGQCLRFEPLYLVLKEAVENNRYGRVKYAYFERLSSMPRWGFDGWYHDTERGGGAIMDLHIHDVDMVRFLFGEPSRASSISYDTKSRWTVVNSRFCYGDDTIIVADASWDEAASTKFSMSYRIRFEKAEIKLEGGKVTVYPDEGAAYQPELPRANRMAEEIKALVMAIAGSGKNAGNPPESAMMTVKLVETLRESAERRGEWVAF